MAKREVSEIWGIWEFDRRFWEGDIEYKFRRLNSWRCDVPALPEIAEDVYFAPAEDLEQEAEAQPHDPVQEAAGHTMEVEDIPMQWACFSRIQFALFFEIIIAESCSLQEFNN